jgi:hypothetical protein
MAAAAGTRSLPGGGKSVFLFDFFSRSTQEHAEAQEHACSCVLLHAPACACVLLVLLAACSCVILHGSTCPVPTLLACNFPLNLKIVLTIRTAQQHFDSKWVKRCLRQRPFP